MLLLYFLIFNNLIPGITPNWPSEDPLSSMHLNLVIFHKKTRYNSTYIIFHQKKSVN